MDALARDVAREGPARSSLSSDLICRSFHRNRSEASSVQANSKSCPVAVETEAQDGAPRRRRHVTSLDQSIALLEARA